MQGGEPPAAAMGDESVLVGTFTVLLVDESPINGTAAFSSVRGVVRDAPESDRMGWEVAAQAGDCSLEVPHFPLCDPRCGAGTACVGDNVCEAEPTAIGVGAVTLAGADTASGPVDIELMKIGTTYQPSADVDVAYPPSAEGAELVLTATGEEHGGFEIRTKGIAPLEVMADGPLVLAPEQALNVAWVPSGPGATSTVGTVVDISHHGGIKGRIVCESADASGQLEIAAPLVTGLIELGTAGFPIITLSRRAVGSATIDLGRVDFAIEQHRELELEVPGVVSCLEAADCPAGQSCMPERRCG